jgi:hypothetical protein
MAIRRINTKAQRATQIDKVAQTDRTIIYTWPVKTMTSRVAGGRQLVYEVVMYEDGFLYCNCPGWLFSRDTKTCKHCKYIEQEAQQRFEEYKRGDFTNFQVIETPVAVEEKRDTLMEQLKASIQPPPAPTPNPNVTRRYGRVIQF